MPVKVDAVIRHLSQEEFAGIAYKVMEQAFAVHNEMGRFFDEDIYRDEVAGRVANAQTEVRIEVTFEDFRKLYSMDLLVAGGGVFELKTVSALGPQHRSQLLNYLLLTGLSHGKLINFQTEMVEHEFVNTHLKLSDRTAFEVVQRNWCDPGPPTRPLLSWLVELLRDIGAGLDVHLYEAAVSHVFGGEDVVIQEIEVFSGPRHLGRQKIRLTGPGWCFKVTTLDEADLSRFEEHICRFLDHTNLSGAHWINITRNQATFTSVKR